MENSGIKRHFGYTIAMYLAWAGLFATIIASLAAMRMADEEAGANYDVGMLIGISISAALGFGVGGLGIVLSVVGLNIGERKPKSAKNFGLYNKVSSLACLGTIVAMAIMTIPNVVNSLANSLTLDPGWRAHSLADVGYNNVILICMVIIAAVCIIGIVSSSRIVNIINKTITHSGSDSVPISSQQSVAAMESQRKSCSACGALNEPDAEFCKKCGKAC